MRADGLRKWLMIARSELADLGRIGIFRPDLCLRPRMPWRSTLRLRFRQDDFQQFILRGCGGLFRRDGDADPAEFLAAIEDDHLPK